MRASTYRRNRVRAAHVSSYKMVHPQYGTNDSYRLHRHKPEGPVSVFNQDGFLMAEYDPITGVTAWHRAVPATKRDAVEKKLVEQFRSTADTSGAAPKPSSKRKPRRATSRKG